MKTYAYKGYGQDGRTQRGLVSANNPKDARERLARGGTLSESITPASESDHRWYARRTRNFGVDVRAMVYHELGALFSAGLSVDQSLDILIDSPELAEHRNILAVVRDEIREGQSLADALSSQSSRVSPFEKAIIEVGERAATLDTIFEELAAFLEEQRYLRDKVRNAMIYPAFVVGIGLIIAVFMLVTVIPWASSLLEEAGRDVPALTRAMVSTGNLVRSAGPFVALALLAGGFWFKHRARTDRALRCRADQRVFGLPVAGRGYTILSNLRFARTMAMLLRAGVPLLEGMALAGRATGSPWIESLVDAESETVRHGSTLEDALRRVPPLAGSLPGWVRAGEASGDLPRLLTNAAERYQRQWESMITRALGLFEPILILVIGGFVLVVTLSILLPILSLSHTLE
ncbi:MAG: type II secretion system F family protein [Verrucomicrobia bacterium]|nr:type II secretion system F family protein [Verrucomicrobiota bacterium]MDA1087584.1 type II secretion system F family protein [Verrucomicrobiota bacterium]